jgi:hypothetical protein
MFLCLSEEKLIWRCLKSIYTCILDKWCLGACIVPKPAVAEGPRVCSETQQFRATPTHKKLFIEELRGLIIPEHGHGNQLAIRGHNRKPSI